MKKETYKKIKELKQSKKVYIVIKKIQEDGYIFVEEIADVFASKESAEKFIKKMCGEDCCPIDVDGVWYSTVEMPVKE